MRHAGPPLSVAPPQTSRLKPTSAGTLKSTSTTNQLPPLPPGRQGDYIKYNSNSGFVCGEAVRNTPHAFSHWTFQHTGVRGAARPGRRAGVFPLMQVLAAALPLQAGATRRQRSAALAPRPYRLSSQAPKRAAIGARHQNPSKRAAISAAPAIKPPRTTRCHQCRARQQASQCDAPPSVPAITPPPPPPG